jgi:hypothetical protein
MDPKIKFTKQEYTKIASDKNFGSIRDYLYPHDHMKQLKDYVDNLSEFGLVRNLKFWILIVFS